VNFDTTGLTIVGPALLAGALVLATHVPLGQEVLRRGIIFIDLAVAQMAGLGVNAATGFGLDAHGVAAQVAAFSAALVGGLVLSWTDRRFGKIQEAIIGVSFILAATGGILLLANNPRAARSCAICWSGKSSGQICIRSRLRPCLRRSCSRAGESSRASSAGPDSICCSRSA
jgi:zinc/manganese transport system permease protein